MQCNETLVFQFLPILNIPEEEFVEIRKEIHLFSRKHIFLLKQLTLGVLGICIA